MAENQQASEGGADPRTKTVLIVDDDESVLNLLEILVKCDGFKVLTAVSGEEAIQKLARKPDAVLLDLVLPGAMSGIGVLRHLRQVPGPHPPVLVITGQDDRHPAVMEAKQDPNVAHFFPKPINQEKLLMLLHRIFKTRAPVRKPPEPRKERGTKP